MLTFSEMVDQVAERINITDTAYKTKIKDWINYRYDDIISRYDWPQLYRTGSTAVAAGDSTLTLPRDIDVLLNIHDRTNDISLSPLNPSAGGRGYVDSIDNSGVTYIYWFEGVSVLAQPSSASVLAVVSSSASDTSQTVRIWGTDSNGAEVNDSVTLNGTNAQNTTVSFARVDRVSKDSNAAGLVSATSNAGAVTVFKMDPYNFGTSNNVIRLMPPSGSAVTFNYTYKFKLPRLLNDEDTPMLDCSHCLVIGAYVSALRQQRQHSKAKALEYNPNEPYDPTTYEGKVRSLIQKFDQQQENVPAMWPEIRRSRDDYTWGYRI